MASARSSQRSRQRRKRAHTRFEGAWRRRSRSMVLSQLPNARARLIRVRSPVFSKYFSRCFVAIVPVSKQQRAILRPCGCGPSLRSQPQNERRAPRELRPVPPPITHVFAAHAGSALPTHGSIQRRPGYIKANDALVTLKNTAKAYGPSRRRVLHPVYLVTTLGFVLLV